MTDAPTFKRRTPGERRAYIEGYRAALQRVLAGPTSEERRAQLTELIDTIERIHALNSSESVTPAEMDTLALFRPPWPLD